VAELAVRAGGGWGHAAYPRMFLDLQARCAAADAE
jgi:hypothetical protein